MLKFLKYGLLVYLCCCQYLLANVVDHRYQKAFRVQALSLEDGLSQSVVYDIIQDQQGFIWVATENGLNRFDGYDFTIFQHSHQDQYSLHDNLIYKLVEDTQGEIWIGTQNGVSLYNPATGYFTNLNHKNPDLKTAVQTIAVMPSKNVFLGSDNGVYVYNRTDDSIAMFTDGEGAHIEDEVVSFEQNDNRLWVATETCIYQIADEINSDLLCNGALGDWLNEKRIKVIRYYQGNLWVGTSRGLARYNVASRELETFYWQKENNNSLSSNWIQDITFDAQGNLWVATNLGLNLYRYTESDFERYLHKTHDNDGLSANDIMSVFVDQTGLIWIGTYAAGLNILDPLQTNFKHILTKSDLAAFNASNTIHGITKDNNENLWMASYGGGVVKLDLMTGKISIPFYDYAQEFNDNFHYAYCVFVDINNRLWVGTYDGVYLVDLNSEQVIPLRFVKNDETYLLNEYIMQVYEDHLGNIWLASIEGLYQVEEIGYQEGALNLKLIEKHTQMPNSFRDRSSRISSILETRDGTLWLGGISGLLRYSKETQKWSHYEYHENNSQSLSNDDVQVLFEDSRGILWVGTGNGLNKVIRDSNDEIYFERITKDDGLPNNAIYGILEDNQKQLWLSTNLGLVKYSGQSETMQSFRRNDGLSSDEFNTGAYYADSDGVLYFGSINGITVVENFSNHKPREPRSLFFTQVRVGQRNLDTYHLNQQAVPTIVKSNHESTIKISIADLFYQKLKTQSYRYRLLGLDDEWVYLDKERTFILAGLSEGKYILDVQSKIANESWSGNNLRAEILVDSDFFQSNDWFYLLSVLSFVFFGSLLYWLRGRYLLRLNKAENMIKIEGVRLKEVRKQNEELQVELENRSTEISLLTEQLNESSQLIDSHQFRDSVTGFYRYKNILRLLSSVKYKDELSPLEFNSFFVLQLCDLQAIQKHYGEICTAEVRSYVATELRRSCPASVHICALGKSSFVVLGNSKTEQQMFSSLKHLYKKLERSQIPVANDISVPSKVSMSYLDIYPDSVKELQLVIDLCEILITSHRRVNLGDTAALMKLTLNQEINSFANIQTQEEVEQLIEADKIAYTFE